MNTDKTQILNSYKEKCGSFKIYEEKIESQTKNQYSIHIIETERFIAKSLCTKETIFSRFPDDIQELYKVTFGDESVMKKYANGEAKTIEYFENLVQRLSKRTLNNNPFSGFIVYDKEDNMRVAGYQILGGGSTNCSSEIAGISRREYHHLSSKQKKYCGYELAGALVWGYAYSLCQKKACAYFNDSYADPFTTVEATARIDNIASYRILENLGFSLKKTAEKFESDRYFYELNFNFFS